MTAVNGKRQPAGGTRPSKNPLSDLNSAIRERADNQFSRTAASAPINWAAVSRRDRADRPVSFFVERMRLVQLFAGREGVRTLLARLKG